MITGKQLGTANTPPPYEQAELLLLWVKGVNGHNHSPVQLEIVYKLLNPGKSIPFKISDSENIHENISKHVHPPHMRYSLEKHSI